jgi:O-antigen ligase
MKHDTAWKEAALSGRVMAPYKAPVPLSERVLPMIDRLLKVAVLLLFMGGLLAVGVLGTETRLLFYWPGAVLLGLAAVAAAVRWRWRVASLPSEVCLGMTLLAGGYFVYRQLTSPVTSWAREDLYILLGCAVAYQITAIALSHPRWRGAVLVTLLLLVIGNLAVGYIHFSGQWTFHVVPHYMRELGYQGRIRGFFINPNHLAAFLSITTLLCLGQALFGRSGAVWRLLLIFLAMASIIAVALTKSRGGMIGLGVGGITLVVISLITLRRAMPHLFWKAAAGLTVIAGLVALVIWAVMSEQIEQRFHQTASTEGDPRSWIWRSAWNQSLEHPLLGSGARMFYEGCMRLRPADAPVWMKDPLFVHNDWLQALTDYGWIGLLLLGATLAVHLGNGWHYLKWFATEQFQRTAALSGRRLGWAVGCLAALAATLTHAFCEFQFHVPAVALTTAVMLGVLANPGFDQKLVSVRRVFGVRLLSKIALGICGVALLCGAWRVGQSDYLIEQAMMMPSDGDPAVKVEKLNDALCLDPDNASAWHQRGLAEMAEAGGKPMRVARPILLSSISDLEQSVQLNPFNGYPMLALADAYDALGRHTEAEQSIWNAVQTMPLHMTPRLALARHYHRLRRWPEAEEAYLWASEGSAWSPEDWYGPYCRMLQDAAK